MSFILVSHKDFISEDVILNADDVSYVCQSDKNPDECLFRFKGSTNLVALKANFNEIKNILIPKSKPEGQ